LQPTLDAPLSIDDHGVHESIAPGSLVFQDVTFSYPGQPAQALVALNLDIPLGHTLGIVGATGAGKSSVLRLILRQYVAQQGQVRWGRHALHDYTLDALQKAISWVPQEPFLFSASVAENITLGKPDASREDIERAARQACIHDDIVRMPQGYDTQVGEKGVTLSGGQRQRVAIARALLADAPVLLLDDALSAVDTHTETTILEHLEALRRTSSSRITIIVSHRLSAVARADNIVVVEGGRIAEHGTHDALVADGKWYAAQWRYQQLEASLDAE
jgi:ATP-binding cassette subfamily B protein/ATP-binding cassette subfamily C protein/ATP-binding cassette subfamily B multidrug efflux pump